MIIKLAEPFPDISGIDMLENVADDPRHAKRAMALKHKLLIGTILTAAALGAGTAYLQRKRRQK